MVVVGLVVVVVGSLVVVGLLDVVGSLVVVGLLDVVGSLEVVVTMTRPRSHVVSTSPKVSVVTIVVSVAALGSESIKSLPPASATVAAMPAGKPLNTA